LDDARVLYNINMLSEMIEPTSRTSWRRALALLWVIFSGLVLLFCIVSQGIIEHPRALDAVIILSFAIVFLVGALAGFRRPFSSRMVLLPVPAAVYIVIRIILLYSFGV
jgi:hypothetical protein